MVTHTLNSCSAINPSKVHTHPEKWAAIYDAVPGEHLEVRCLAQEHLSRGIEGEEEHRTFLQFLPARDSLGHDFPF